MVGMIAGMAILVSGVALSIVDFLPGLVVGISGGALFGMSLAQWQESRK